MNPKSRARWLSLLVLGFALVACSRLDLAVRWADTYIASSVDDYFDLSSNQSKELKSHLRADIDRVCLEKFPTWAKNLRAIEAELGSGAKISREKFHQIFQQVIGAGRELGPVFASTTKNFVLAAAPSQLDHLEKNRPRKNVDDQKKIQDRKKTRKEYRQRYLGWTDLWIDSLTNDQEKLLDAHLDENPFPLELQLKNKLYVLDRFALARKSPKSLEIFLEDYVNDRISSMILNTKRLSSLTRRPLRTSPTGFCRV